jgi:hypothetical protein
VGRIASEKKLEMAASRAAAPPCSAMMCTGKLLASAKSVGKSVSVAHSTTAVNTTLAIVNRGTRLDLRRPFGILPLRIRSLPARSRAVKEPL